MALQLKFFIIPVSDIEPCEQEINRFLRSVRVVNMQRDFVDQGPNSFWSVAIEYLPAAKSASEKDSLKKSKIDYKQVLSPGDFALFAKLREWRKIEAAEIGEQPSPLCQGAVALIGHVGAVYDLVQLVEGPLEIAGLLVRFGQKQLGGIAARNSHGLGGDRVQHLECCLGLAALQMDLGQQEATLRSGGGSIESGHEAGQPRDGISGR